MFGSISNWVNENKPAMPSMPNVSMPSMPAMPNVSMPSMPQMPAFLNKNNNPKEPAESEVDEVAVKLQEPGEAGEVTDASAVQERELSAEKVDVSPENEPAVDEYGQQEAETKNGAGYKILDSSKEIGSNIGSMYLILFDLIVKN